MSMYFKECHCSLKNGKEAKHVVVEKVKNYPRKS